MKCRVCTLELLVENFPVYRTVNGIKFRRHSCRTCTVKQDKLAQSRWEPERVQATKVHLAEWHKQNDYNNSIRFRYGLSKIQYQELVEKQKGLCALCEKPQNPGKRNGRLSVDHDHKTGKVRGLLCVLCNIMLGRYDDSIKKFEKIPAYLRGEQ